MKQEEFEQLLTAADLHPWQASRDYGMAWSVALHVPTAFGIRHQCDWLVYQPAEFAMMTTQQAERHVAACVARLERAAKTKQGVTK